MIHNHIFAYMMVRLFFCRVHFALQGPAAYKARIMQSLMKTGDIHSARGLQAGEFPRVLPTPGLLTTYLQS